MLTRVRLCENSTAVERQSCPSEADGQFRSAILFDSFELGQTVVCSVFAWIDPTQYAVESWKYVACTRCPE